MTQYELLKASESLCLALDRNRVEPSDARHLEVFEELERMEREGHKKTFIIAYLCNQYDLSEATLYRIANRMRRQIT